jgi:DNA polymerase V
MFALYNREKGVNAVERSYLCIDLKSFYASVECRQRGLDPLTTLLAVADESRTEKTICLAVSPALKAYGISGRARLFEANEQVRRANAQRRQSAPGNRLTGSATNALALAADPSLAIDFIIAPPRMGLYMQVSTIIYNVYLRYIAPEDIHVYSIDEVFIDLTPYLNTYHATPHQMAQMLVQAVLRETGITATAGIGTNLYLAKVAMDIVAKKMPADAHGCRIAQLDERSYRQQLWDHQPITDFWRVGRGYARKLEKYGLHTMGDIALCSLGGPGDYYNEDLLYKLFGINAELLIDHAWGWESCTLQQIKGYKPASHSISSGQVLCSPYSAHKARVIVEEMLDLLVLDLVEKKLQTDQIVLTIGYDRESLSNPAICYAGPVTTDPYGRAIPKPATGSVTLGGYTSSTRRVLGRALELYDRIVDPSLLVRRVTVAACHVLPRHLVPQDGEGEQMDLFAPLEQQETLHREEQRELRRQEAVLRIQHKYGKNAILKGMNFREGATTIARNGQVGGHKR